MVVATTEELAFVQSSLERLQDLQDLASTVAKLASTIVLTNQVLLGSPKMAESKKYVKNEFHVDIKELDQILQNQVLGIGGPAQDVVELLSQSTAAVTSSDASVGSAAAQPPAKRFRRLTA